MRGAGFPGCVQISVSDHNKALTQKSVLHNGNNFGFSYSSLKYKTPAAFENLNRNFYFRVALVNEG